MDFLKSTIASIAAKTNSAFPYTLTEKVEFQNDTIWNLHHATRRSDNLSCSVFEFDINSQRSRLALARNAVKKLRTLRYPGIIKVLDTYESDSSILIATEHVIPLDILIQSDSLNSDLIKWGLYSIANSVKFINVEASSVHGNIRESSIFISDSGEWKLSGFELLTSTKDEEPIIYTFGGLVPDARRYAAPEIKGGWDILKKQPHHLLDSYLFGALIFEVFNGRFATSDQLQSSMRKNIPAELFGPFKKLVQPVPRQRASVKQFVDVGRDERKETPGSGFFKTDMIDLTEGLENLSLQSEYERDIFVKELNHVQDKFPASYLRKRVLPELLSCFEFSSGGPKILGVILDISQTMTPEDCQAVVGPTIAKMFSSPDRAIRLALLESLPRYIDYFSSKTINEKVFQDISTGFTDVAPAVREQTVKAVLVIVPKLSERNINNDLLRYLARVQNDEQPGIRTNTTICLGKIANNLGPHTRARVLSTAFTRSLRDPFVHARNAALMALAVTVDIFSPDDCCNKLLPAICPTLLDREKLVRVQAHKTMEIYLNKVNHHAATMPDAGSAQALSSQPTSQAGTPKPVDGEQQAAGDASWTGWAINGFAKRLNIDETDDHGLPVRSERESSDSSSTAGHAAGISAGSSVTGPSSSTSSLAFGSTATQPSKFDPITDDDDFGWGDMDSTHDMTLNNAPEDDWGAFDDPAPAPTPASAPAPVRSVISTTTATRPAAPSRLASVTSATTTRTTASVTRTMQTGKLSGQKPAATKSHSIAAHKQQKKKESIFADADADGDDGWGDQW
ncbi:armadillo-type protein [Limtongia smithiae]|uniref:armadillo-type protein n=1 Tax=Limtongia smithiae TaxID=1125753 RepID=UPI0034CEEB1D